MILGLDRPLIRQQLQTFSIAVGTTPVPIQPNVQKQDLITTFVISNPVGGTSVFLGNIGVTSTTGLEIPGGTAPVFIVNQVRQLYEVQAYAMDIDARAGCKNVQTEAIPFVVWDMSNIFLVSTGAGQTVSVALFPEMFI